MLFWTHRSVRDARMWISGNHAAGNAQELRSEVRSVAPCRHGRSSSKFKAGDPIPQRFGPRASVCSNEVRKQPMLQASTHAKNSICSLFLSSSKFRSLAPCRNADDGKAAHRMLEHLFLGLRNRWCLEVAMREHAGQLFQTWVVGEVARRTRSRRGPPATSRDMPTGRPPSQSNTGRLRRTKWGAHREADPSKRRRQNFAEHSPKDRSAAAPRQRSRSTIRSKEAGDHFETTFVLRLHGASPTTYFSTCVSVSLCLRPILAPISLQVSSTGLTQDHCESNYPSLVYFDISVLVSLGAASAS